MPEITVPSIVWSGVLGALSGAIFALIGTLITNRGNNTRQDKQLRHDVEQRKAQLDHDISQRKIQLEHDSEQRKLEREMNLRREVYLSAADAVGSLTEYIAHSSRGDVSEADRLALVKGNAGILNKIHIVGSDDAIKAFSEAQGIFARSTFKVEERRLAVLRATLDVEAHERILQSLHKKREQITETLRAVGQQLEQETLESIVREFHEAGLAIDHEAEAIEELRKALLEAQLALAEDAVAANLDLQEAFSEAVLAARSELSLPLNRQNYRTLMGEHGTRLRQDFGEFVARVKSQVADETEEEAPAPNQTPAPDGQGHR